MASSRGIEGAVAAGMGMGGKTADAAAGENGMPIPSHSEELAPAEEASVSVPVEEDEAAEDEEDAEDDDEEVLASPPLDALLALAVSSSSAMGCRGVGPAADDGRGEGRAWMDAADAVGDAPRAALATTDTAAPATAPAALPAPVPAPALAMGEVTIVVRAACTARLSTLDAALALPSTRPMNACLLASDWSSMPVREQRSACPCLLPCAEETSRAGSMEASLALGRVEGAVQSGQWACLLMSQLPRGVPLRLTVTSSLLTSTGADAATEAPCPCWLAVAVPLGADPCP